MIYQTNRATCRRGTSPRCSRCVRPGSGCA